MEKRKPRYMYIDLLRGWAVLVMIEVHVVNTFLVPELRLQSWFTVLNFINGLVAPTFLFITGYAFVLVAQRKWDDYLAGNRVLVKQVGRILQIWAVGYALHIPVFSLARMTEAPAQLWESFWKVDVLHCIAFSLLLMLALAVALRRQKYFIVAVSAIGLAVILATPFTWALNIDASAPMPVADYFNSLHGSLFPLLPWMGFVLFGGMVSYAVVHLRETMSPGRIFAGILLIGLLLIVVCTMLSVMPFTLYPPHHYGRSSPLFVFIRIGIVMVLLSVLYFWEQAARSGPSLISIVGSESLVAYSFHLLAIYGLFFDGKSLSFIIGRTRTLPEAAAMTAVLIAATIAVSYVWNWLKHKNMTYARIMQYSLLAVVLAIFLTKT